MEMKNFDEEIESILQRDNRYPREAYAFVRDALEHTHKMLRKNRQGAQAHVTGQELLEGIRDYALKKFGPLTLLVFEEWGIRRCEDFGEIVFNLVDEGVLAKTESDSRDYFKGGYDFIEAFQKPFRPVSKGRTSPKSN
jgi:uncharacterized repeat protein (TIGR04138 family)